MVTISTFVATVLLFIVVPKGFFPVQDTGVILGISEAPQTVSFAAWPAPAEARGHSACRIRRSINISSFIGVDGTNTTLNSGRIQINLKPLEVRKISASEVIRRLQPKLQGVEGISALPAAAAGPDGGRSREPDRVPVFARRSRPERAGQLHAQDGERTGQGKGGDRRGQRPAGPGAGRATGDRSRHRGAAGHRHGRHGQHALRRLRPAPGFHHLHPAQPVPRGDGGRAELPDRSRDAEQSLRQIRQRHPGSAQHGGPLGAVARATGHRPPGAVPVHRDQLQPGAGQVAGRCRQGRQPHRTAHPDAGQPSMPASRARPRPSRPRSPTSRC